jgi:hypothetical protein
MARNCELCGQPLPERKRRDPPLPQLDAPAVVTIHDLAPGTPFKVKKEDWGIRLLVADDKRVGK